MKAGIFSTYKADTLPPTPTGCAYVRVLHQEKQISHFAVKVADNRRVQAV